MMRPVLALMAGLVCGTLGMRRARSIREENARLHRWENLLRHMCLLLQEGTLPLTEVLEQAAAEATPADELLRSLSGSLRRDPMTSLSALYTPQGKEGPVLRRLFAALEHGSLEQRVLCATQAAQEMALLAQTSMGKSDQDASMWAKLGWLGGACLTLMLM
jgi:hypothetical protein